MLPVHSFDSRLLLHLHSDCHIGVRGSVRAELLQLARERHIQLYARADVFPKTAFEIGGSLYGGQMSAFRHARPHFDMPVCISTRHVPSAVVADATP